MASGCFRGAGDGAPLSLFGRQRRDRSGTEKARSDFVVGPVLLEFRRTVGERVKVFSGVDWAVDPDKGLNGVCDFILTTGSSSHILEAPFLAIAEAKNDQIRTGFGQCFAAMVAAQMANESAGLKPRTIYGVVTTGAIWQFNRLSGTELTIDGHEYSLDRLARVMGILHAIAASK